MAKTTLHDDVDDREASEAAEKLSKKLEAPPPDEPVEVSLEEDDEDEDDEPARPTRLDKKRNRFKEKVQESDQLRQQLAAMQQQQAMMAGYLQAQAQRQQGPQEDPFDAEIAKTYEAHKRLIERAQMEVQSGRLTPEQVKEREKEWFGELNRIEQYRAQLQYRKAQMASGETPQAAAQRAYLHGIVMENNDVFGNQQAHRYAIGLWNQRMAEGRPENMELVQEVLEETRARFRMPRAKRPQTTEKRQMAGISRGAGASAPGAAPRSITMTPALRKVAVAWGESNGLSEGEAIKQWAKKHGAGYMKRVAEKNARGR